MRDFTVESNGRDCKHGRLARKCEICEMEAEIADAQRRINEIREDCDRRLMIRDAEIERLREHLTVIAECENVTYCELCRDRAKIAVREARDGKR